MIIDTPTVLPYPMHNIILVHSMAFAPDRGSTSFQSSWFQGATRGMARADTVIVCSIPLAKNALHLPTSIHN